MIAVADTGFVLAVAIATDRWHSECVALYRQHRRIYLPQTGLSETAYLLTREGGNLTTARFLENLPQSKYRLVALADADIQMAANYLKQYADARLDFVDVSVAVIAERLAVRRILTLDQRDFNILRPTVWKYFELLPG